MQFSFEFYIRLIFDSFVVSLVGVLDSFVIPVSVFFALSIVIWDVISLEYKVMFREFGPSRVWTWVDYFAFPLWVLFA